jgi:three-Cys-motif partner protein
VATSQDEFGGAWTQQKLVALGKYLQAYTNIFKRNRRAQYYSISYVDAFAGTGSLQRPEPGALAEFLPELLRNEEQYRKGSVLRALDIEPPFDNYIFIEKSAEKCNELRRIAEQVRSRSVRVIKEDANSGILRWCQELDTKRQRAVVFLDPFGASVKWEAIIALGKTKAVDLWVLFPYSAINRMLIRDRKPEVAWARRLTEVFGTSEWESAFYSTSSWPSLFDSAQSIELVHKSADYRVIADFFVSRLNSEFEAVSNPLRLYNSRGSLLFMLFFAAGNDRSAQTGLKIANSIIGK